MSLAWALFKSTKTNLDTFGEALSAAWKAVKAKAAINGGGAVVTFTKADGTEATRPALAFAGPVKGTGMSNPLTILYHNPKTKKPGSFRADRLIGFLDIAQFK